MQTPLCQAVFNLVHGTLHETVFIGIFHRGLACVCPWEAGGKLARYMNIVHHPRPPLHRSGESSTSATDHLVRLFSQEGWRVERQRVPELSCPQSSAQDGPERVNVRHGVLCRDLSCTIHS